MIGFEVRHLRKVGRLCRHLPVAQLQLPLSLSLALKQWLLVLGTPPLPDLPQGHFVPGCTHPSTALSPVVLGISFHAMLSLSFVLFLFRFFAWVFVCLVSTSLLALLYFLWDGIPV
eukprot:RCo015943